MIVQSENRVTLTKQLKKAFIVTQLFYPIVFEKFGKTHEEKNMGLMKSFYTFIYSGKI